MGHFDTGNTFSQMVSVQSDASDISLQRTERGSRLLLCQCERIKALNRDQLASYNTIPTQGSVQLQMNLDAPSQLNKQPIRKH